MEENNTQVKSNNGLIIGFGLIVLLALVGIGYYYFQNKDAEPATDDTSNLGTDTTEIPSGLDTEGEGPVARVNGEDINRTDYRLAVQQLINSYAAQGVTVSDEEAPQIKEQVITTLVNRQLVLQAAVAGGITIDDAAVEAEYQNTLTNLGGEEALQSALEEANLNESELRADLREGLVINAYLDNQLDLNNITVTDAEVEAYYNTAKESADQTEVPPLAEVRELIENQLVAQTQQQLINEEIERLRAEASVEVLI